jgi:hypothetical protein
MLVGTALLAALVFAAVSPNLDRACREHAIACGMLTGFVNTALLAIGGYVFLFRLTRRRAVRHYLTVARDQTPRLFAAPPGRIKPQDVVGRARLYEIVDQELRSATSGSPVVVVGPAGSGKTTFVFGLVHYLAARGTVPISLSLRAAEPPISFRNLAREEFLRHVDRQVRSGEDGDRIWRDLFARRGIVVLADGLDEVAPDASSYERDQFVRAALDGARDDRLRLVTTSRPEAVPPESGLPELELDPLGEREAIEFVSRHARRSLADAERTQVRDLIRRVDATDHPFYLNVISALSETGGFDGISPTLAPERLRVALLDEYVDRVKAGRLAQDTRLPAGDRALVVAGLADVAGALTIASALEVRLSTLAGLVEELNGAVPSRSELSGSAVTSIVDGAVRLGLMRAHSSAGETRVRFGHAISQSYFASRLLRANPAVWATLFARTSSTEMMRALVMWCAAALDASQATRVCTALVQHADRTADDRAVAYIATACEIADVLDFEGFGERIEKSAETAWANAAAKARRAAVLRLRHWQDPWNYLNLWRRIDDPDYAVRWQAAQAIADGGLTAFERLRPRIEATIDVAENQAPDDWVGPHGRAVSVLGWILPAMATSAADPDGGPIRGYVHRWAGLVSRSIAAGVESSIAQGFKLDAFRTPAAPVDPLAVEMLGAARFWYARIVLLHAICRRCVEVPEANTAAIEVLQGKAADRKEHPFVQEAARQCVTAVRTKDWARFLWEDESTAISRSGISLSDETNTLIAELVLLLNLTEQGEGTEREDRKARAYLQDRLPPCFAESRHRREFSTGCGDQCTFRLCPYPLEPGAVLARGQFSEAFYLHQQYLAGRRRRSPWQGSIRKRALRNFWSELGEHARS